MPSSRPLTGALPLPPPPPVRPSKPPLAWTDPPSLPLPPRTQPPLQETDSSQQSASSLPSSAGSAAVAGVLSSAGILPLVLLCLCFWMRLRKTGARVGIRPKRRPRRVSLDPTDQEDMEVLVKLDHDFAVEVEVDLRV